MYLEQNVSRSIKYNATLVSSIICGRPPPPPHMRALSSNYELPPLPCSKKRKGILRFVNPWADWCGLAASVLISFPPGACGTDVERILL